MADDVAHLRKHIRTYIYVFLTLGALTLVTVWASYLPISTQGHVVVALLIAAIKAALVALFFMHLISERRLIHRILAFTGIFFLGLIFLSLFAYFDHPDIFHRLK